MKAYYQGKIVPDAIKQELARRAENGRLVQSLRGQLTLGDIADDPRSRRFAVSQVDQSRMSLVNFAAPNRAQKFPNLQGTTIDPTNIVALPARGSTPSTINGTIAFTSTTTSITWTWTSLQILRADGSVTNISNGNITFSSLTANTPYWFYPYWSEATQSVNWAGGANTAASLSASQTMNLQYNVPLSAGGIKVTTPSAGSGGGSGGGGGNGCLYPSQLVWTRDGEKEAVDLGVGDEVMTPSGWSPILEVKHETCSDWVRIQLDDDRDLMVTPSQPLYFSLTQHVEAERVDTGDSLMAQYGMLRVVDWDEFQEEAFKVVITISEPHVFYMYEGGPLAHNGTVKP